MTFSDSDIDNMLQATGQTATIDDGSLTGQGLWCKFIAPQQIATEYSSSVSMSAPSAKIRTSAVATFLARGLRFRTGNKDYKIKAFYSRTSGFTILDLEDA